MARIRSINPKAGKDEDLHALSHPARFTFLLLPCHADAEGRLEDRPRYLQTEILPYDKDVDMDMILSELAMPRMVSTGPFILRYQVAGRKYIQILRFDRHQNPHKNEREAHAEAVDAGEAIPPPPNELTEECLNTVQVPSLNGTNPADPGSLILDPGSLIVMSASPMPPKRERVKRFWWDEAKKRIEASVEASEEHWETWSRRGLTEAEYIAQAQACSRWLEDRPEKRREGANLANRLNNWLNTYLTNRRANGNGRAHPPGISGEEHPRAPPPDKPVDPEIYARHQARETERFAKIQAWRMEKPPDGLTHLAKVKWAEEWKARKP